MARNEMPKYGVFGRPVSHSRSPEMFRVFTSGKARYMRISVENAGEIVDAAGQLGLQAFNVTAPFKEDMAGLCDALDEGGNMIKAVNTCVVKDGKVKGYNTDIAAVGSILQSIKGVENMKAAVIGAGGAGKAALAALAQKRIDTVLINRSRERGERAAGMFNIPFLVLDKNIDYSRFDIVIRAVPPLARVYNSTIENTPYTVDAVYHPKDAENKLRGKVDIGGGRWLLEQGKEACRLMTGEVPAETDMGWHRGKPGTRISLSGMMLSGKSTMANMLSEYYKNTVDLDLEIERFEGKSIKELFMEGEDTFRKAEEAAYFRMADEYPEILALGGGALENKRISASIAEDYYNILMWRSDTGENTDEFRPLLAGDGKRLYDKIFEKRKEHYLDCADLVYYSKGPLDEKALKRMLDEIHNII